MKKITFDQLRNAFYKHESSGKEGHLTGYIVFTADSFKKPYSLESRTYVVSSDNKAFQPDKISNSIFASALDGSDECVRLDMYIYDGWKIDYCYMQ